MTACEYYSYSHRLLNLKYSEYCIHYPSKQDLAVTTVSALVSVVCTFYFGCYCLLHYMYYALLSV
jgi:hypothetical protein